MTGWEYEYKKTILNYIHAFKNEAFKEHGL